MGTRELAAQVAKGDRRALAKAISVVENDSRLAEGILNALKPMGTAFVVGVTGPPGTGKSTLVDKLISAYRKNGVKVGVIAVDPTSPITGGALLGDRVRMLGHSGDKGVFIRSMATRGWTGGLSRATSQVIQLMDAAGFEVVFVETVGIGQSDIEIAGVAHAVLVVLMPGMGDDVQMSKAGLMEIGDIYVVSKGDLPGADSTVVSLLSMVRSIRSRHPVVVKASAQTGEGLEKLERAIEEIRAIFDQGNVGIRLRSVRGMIIEIAKGNAMEYFVKSSSASADALAREVLSGKLTITEAATKLSVRGLPASQRNIL